MQFEDLTILDILYIKYVKTAGETGSFYDNFKKDSAFFIY